MAYFLWLPRGPIIAFPGNLLAEDQQLDGCFRGMDHAGKVGQHRPLSQNLQCRLQGELLSPH